MVSIRKAKATFVLGMTTAALAVVLVVMQLGARRLDQQVELFDDSTLHSDGGKGDQWKDSIKQMWNRRNALGIPEESKVKPAAKPAAVWSMPGQGKYTNDPYTLAQMGVGGGVSRNMRRITVRRQDMWDHSQKILGQPGFIGAGMVPPKVPIIGNAGMGTDDGN